MEYQPMKYIYQPAPQQPAAYTLLLLHGTGGDENDLLSLGQYFGNVNILSLRGNVQEHGMPRFFKRLGMGIFDEKDLEFRTHEMVAFIEQLSTQEGFDKSKIIALGYSNGANIAGSTLVLYPDFFAGAILYRPMQPFKDMRFAKQGSAPVFMSNGVQDPTINTKATEQFVTVMKEADYDVTAHSLNTGHQLTPDDIRLSVDWYKNNFSNGGL